LHSTHLRTAAVGGLVGIGGREKAHGFWALWAAGLPFIEDGSTSVETFLNLYKDRKLGTELRNRNQENYGYLKGYIGHYLN